MQEMQLRTARRLRECGAAALVSPGAAASWCAEEIHPFTLLSLWETEGRRKELPLASQRESLLTSPELSQPSLARLLPEGKEIKATPDWLLRDWHAFGHSAL